MEGVIAIVGRPNVGKSALFNRMAGRRIAIVHDRPGVTRDRISMRIEWRDRKVDLIDTGGIGLAPGERSGDRITDAALDQAQLAIEAASVIVLVVDVREGVLPLDLEVAERLRRSGRPVVVAANKADSGEEVLGSNAFARLGFGRVVAVSAIHDRGIPELLGAVEEFLDEDGGAEDTEEEPLRLAIVGRPNVGKSSLINALDSSKRLIVSEVPGTTRDAVEVPVVIRTGEELERYLLIDTAGIRKRRRVDDSVEYFSVRRSEEAIGRADIVLHIFDARDGVTQQDKKIADIIAHHSKACILVVNKWDLYAGEVERAAASRVRSRKPILASFGDWVRQQMFFEDHAPVIFTSARDGSRLDSLLDAVRHVADQLRQTIPTPILNRTLHDAIESQQPASAGGRLKFYYATQAGTAPPTFLLFVNRRELFSPQYRKYIDRTLRRAFGYEGCPLRIVPKSRPRTIEPIRKPKSGQRKMLP